MSLSGNYVHPMVLMEQCRSLLAKSSNLPPIPAFLEAPAWEAALLRKTLSYSNLDLSTNSSPIPMSGQFAGSPQQRPHSVLKKHQYPAPQIKLLCPTVKGRGNSEDRTIVNPVPDYKNTMPISETCNRASELLTPSSPTPQISSSF